jgi:hypothetical protein
MIRSLAFDSVRDMRSDGGIVRLSSDDVNRLECFFRAGWNFWRLSVQQVILNACRTRFDKRSHYVIDSYCVATVEQSRLVEPIAKFRDEPHNCRVDVMSA